MTRQCPRPLVALGLLTAVVAAVPLPAGAKPKTRTVCGHVITVGCDRDTMTASLVIQAGDWGLAKDLAWSEPTEAAGTSWAPAEEETACREDDAGADGVRAQIIAYAIIDRQPATYLVQPTGAPTAEGTGSMMGRRHRE